MAIKSFANQMTADVAAGVNSKFSRRLPQRMLAASRKLLDALHAATRLADMARPGWKLHELGRDRPGFYSAWVNDQYRLVFRFEKGDAYDVEIIDYH